MFAGELVELAENVGGGDFDFGFGGLFSSGLAHLGLVVIHALFEAGDVVFDPLENGVGDCLEGFVVGHLGKSAEVEEELVLIADGIKDVGIVEETLFVHGAGEDVEAGFEVLLGEGEGVDTGEEHGEDLVEGYLLLHGDTS